TPHDAARGERGDGQKNPHSPRIRGDRGQNQDRTRSFTPGGVLPYRRRGRGVFVYRRPGRRMATAPAPSKGWGASGGSASTRRSMRGSESSSARSVRSSSNGASYTRTRM